MIKGSLMLLVAILLGIGALLWLGLVLTNNDSIEGLDYIQRTLADNELILTIFRIGLILLIYNYWNNLCEWFGKHKNLDTEAVDLLIKTKNKTIIWFIAFEIIINQNLIGLILEKI